MQNTFTIKENLKKVKSLHQVPPAYLCQKGSDISQNGFVTDRAGTKSLTTVITIGVVATRKESDGHLSGVTVPAKLPLLQTFILTAKSQQLALQSCDILSTGGAVNFLQRWFWQLGHSLDTAWNFWL